MLGYRQPSFLSQMTGPNPTREITEKTARRFEQELGLPEGYLDTLGDAPTTPAAPAAPAQTVNEMELVTAVIRLIGAILDSESVNLPPAKLADVIALAYADAKEHDSAPRPDYIKQIVRLLK